MRYQSRLKGPARGPFVCWHLPFRPAIPFPGVAVVDRPVVNPALRASPRFRQFWLARLLSHTAQNAILLALLVTVVNETGSTIHSSLLVLTFVVPAALLGVPGGVIVDRLPKREVLVTTGLFRTAVSLLFLRAGGGVPAIYLTNLGIALITQLASPAESAALPALVPPAQLVAATAGLNLEVVLSQVLGTVLLAPLLVKTVGLRPLFALTAASFLAASLLYARLPGIGEQPAKTEPEPAGEQTPGALAGMRRAALECWRLIRSDREILVSVVEQTLVASTVVVLVSIVPIYTRSVLHLRAEYSVAVFSPAAVGMFLALRLVPDLSKRFAKPRLVSLGFAAFVLLLALLGFSRELAMLLHAHDPLHVLGLRSPAVLFSRTAFAAILSGPLGFAYGLVLVVARAILYERVPLAMQGRVFALQGVLSNVGSILPLVLVGVVAYWLGPRAVLVIVAAANVVAAWYAFRLTTPAQPMAMGLETAEDPPTAT